MTDSHANLPALQSALKAVHLHGYDLIIHTGDSFAIGPYPSECFDLLSNTPNIRFTKGNHEAYFVEGLTPLQTSIMGEGEVEHQKWTHAQLREQAKAIVKQWPYRIDIDQSGTMAAFLHYPLDALGRDFLSIRLVRPEAAQLDEAFAGDTSSAIFCGHEHTPFDVQERCRYVNPGSLGCSTDSLARYLMLDISEHGFTVEHHAEPYDMTAVLRAFEQRRVPEREFILKRFFGRNQ
jgi:predicted phosphodiesterase